MKIDKSKNAAYANPEDAVLASEKIRKNLIAELENALEKLVRYSFTKFYGVNAAMFNLYTNYSHDHLVWLTDVDTCERIGINVEVKAMCTDYGWRTFVRLNESVDYGVIPTCIRNFTFDVNICADDHLRSQNTIETFHDEFYKVHLDEYVRKTITEDVADSALAWLKGYVTYLRLADDA